jgi:hypothetical protein
MTDADARSRREPHTADWQFIPRELPLDSRLEATLEQRTRECAERGHRWLDPASRTFCTYCACAWQPDSN